MRERTKRVVRKVRKLMEATYAAEEANRKRAYGRLYGYLRRVHETGRLGEHCAALYAISRTRQDMAASAREATKSVTAEATVGA
jgi:hypothetical protein